MHHLLHDDVSHVRLDGSNLLHLSHVNVIHLRLDDLEMHHLINNSVSQLRLDGLILSPVDGEKPTKGPRLTRHITITFAAK